MRRRRSQGIELRGALLRGAAAGAIGTAAMTVLQLAVRRAQGKRLDTPVPRTWDEAPAPAQVVKKAAEAVGEGRRVAKRHVPLLTNALHWSYGTTWGLGYGFAAHVVRPRNPLAGGLALGVAAWAAAYAELVPTGIYEPPWRYPASELALDLGYHLAYGLGVAGA